jgi:pyruvate formate lyase activating enzyme
MADIFMRQSLLSERQGNKVRCNVCERRCLLVEGGLGWCQTRENRDGRLVTLTYGAASSVAVNPIEKKPFYHFYPGSLTLTVGSWSCNFGCPWCQNADISKVPPPATGRYLSPEEFVDWAKRRGCRGVSISFNEPTLSLEWSLDVFRLARDLYLYNTFVTNGYMTPEALDLLIDAGLDAMNVDIKGDAQVVRHYCKGIDVDKVWQVCRRACAKKVHVEITTLVIPGVNDSETVLRGIAERIASDLGTDVPWHVSGYYPAFLFTAPRTPVRKLEEAYEIGKQAHLRFVYVGNVPGHRYDDTRCPSCDAVLIRRHGYDVLANSLRGGRCPECGSHVAGVWGG